MIAPIGTMRAVFRTVVLCVAILVASPGHVATAAESHKMGPATVMQWALANASTSPNDKGVLKKYRANFEDRTFFLQRSEIRGKRVYLDQYLVIYFARDGKLLWWQTGEDTVASGRWQVFSSPEITSKNNRTVFTGTHYGDFQVELKDARGRVLADPLGNVAFRQWIEGNPFKLRVRGEAPGPASSWPQLVKALP